MSATGPAIEQRFNEAIARIDAANDADPNRLVVRGLQRPKELAHAELVTEWVHRLQPNASEALLLAARAHHIKRWTIPRSSYPSGRADYLRWRRALHDVHANEVGAILDATGYDTATVERVQQLVRKKGLGRDPEVQVLEDALCLVFVETQLDDLGARFDDEKVVDVIVKTMRKMSDQAIEIAATIELPPHARALLETAVKRRNATS